MRVEAGFCIGRCAAAVSWSSRLSSLPLRGVTAQLRCPGSIPPCGDVLQHVAFKAIAAPIFGSLMSVIPQSRPGAATLEEPAWAGIVPDTPRGERKANKGGSARQMQAPSSCRPRPRPTGRYLSACITGGQRDQMIREAFSSTFGGGWPGQHGRASDASKTSKAPGAPAPVLSLRRPCGGASAPARQGPPAAAVLRQAAAQGRAAAHQRPCVRSRYSR